jgi:tetratricopeptide (TPR) repeat protein
MLSDVARTPIAQTIRRLSIERRSGDLQVRSGRMAKIVFFDHGRLVFAASNLRRDRLGEALVADRCITQQDYDRVSALMRADRGRRFGEALVQAGVMDRYEVGTAVARQVRRIALSLFELGDGAAAFEERGCTIPLEYMVSLSVHRLLYDGIRQMKSEALVLAGLGPLDRCVVLAEVPPFPYEPKGRPAEELDILELAQRRVTVRRLAWGAGGLSFSRLRASYALLAAGILREADAPSAAQPVLQTETGMFLLSALQSRPDPSLREAIRREVQQELAHSARLDREGWLKLAQAAPRSALIGALEDKMERYHALRDGVGSDEGLLRDIDVILGRAASALRRARLAPEDASAEAVLARHAAEAAAAVQQSSSSPGPAAAFAPAAPAPQPQAAEQAPPAGPAPAAAAAAFELQPERPQAPTAAAAAAGPDSTNPRGPAAAAPAAAGPTSMPKPDQSIRMVPPGSSAFEGQAQIEHLLMEGEVRMTVGDYANAVKVYEKLADVAPRVAAFRIRLATAMACYPPAAKLAEREFYDAARLEPDNPEIHYQWALYYKMMKVKSRAVAELRTAVRLNPRHHGARRELEALSPRDSALTSLKKMFR